MKLIEFPDPEALTVTVSRHVHAHLRQCLQARSQASIVLSGGSTPMPIYAHLATMALDWSRVTALPSDERWVAVEDSASNTGQIRRQFGQAGLKLNSLVPDRPTGDADPAHAEDVLRKLPMSFDLVMLGMGGDAHFASLFPHSDALVAGLDPASTQAALALTPDPLPPEAPYARISLSLSRLLKTRRLLLVITGQAKREVLRQAAAEDADDHHMPVAALLRAAGDQLEVYWSP